MFRLHTRRCSNALRSAHTRFPLGGLRSMRRAAAAHGFAAAARRPAGRESDAVEVMCALEGVEEAHRRRTQFVLLAPASHVRHLQRRRMPNACGWPGGAYSWPCMFACLGGRSCRFHGTWLEWPGVMCVTRGPSAKLASLSCCLTCGSNAAVALCLRWDGVDEESAFVPAAVLSSRCV